MRPPSLAALLLALSLPADAVDLNPPQLDPKYSEGCWVRFFDQPGMKEPFGRIAGQLYITSIAPPGLIGNMDEEDFFRRARSLTVGPEARLLAYAEPGFRKEILNLEPGREVSDLHALGFPKEVASVKIVCERKAEGAAAPSPTRGAAPSPTPRK